MSLRLWSAVSTALHILNNMKTQGSEPFLVVTVLYLVFSVPWPNAESSSRVLLNKIFTTEINNWNLLYSLFQIIDRLFSEMFVDLISVNVISPVGISREVILGFFPSHLVWWLLHIAALIMTRPLIVKMSPIYHLLTTLSHRAVANEILMIYYF